MLVDRSDPPPRHGLSLEHKLPLLITGLIIATLTAGVFFAYLEVRKAAVEGAHARLEILAERFAELVTPLVEEQLAELQRLASAPAVSAYLLAPSAESEAAVSGAMGQVSGYLTQAVVLHDARGTPLLRSARTDDPAVRAAALDGTGDAPPAPLGRFFPIASTGYYRISRPVIRGGDTIGFVSELRGVGTPQTSRSLTGWMGEGVEVGFADEHGSVWVGLDGSVRPVPPGGPFEGPSRFTPPGEAARLAHVWSLAGTPWQVIVQQPRDLVMARPDAFLRHALLAIAILSILGAIGAWLLSRAIMRPVRELHLASDAIARGDYGWRITLTRRDEFGDLADSFNWMADQVASSHDELREQYETAHLLAAKLEQANRQLEVAIDEAERSRDEAESANRAKSDFLATMSHEIRTPINAIIGYTDLLHLGLAGPVTEAQEGHLERIRVSGRHLAALVDQVLDLARVEAGTLTSHREVASLHHAVEIALTVVRPQAIANEVELVHLCAGGEDINYLGDPQSVEQILVNLLSNAAKFTEKGGRGTIRCELRPGEEGEAGVVSVTIEDSGVGIPDDQWERIFEPFVQVDSGYTRRHGGAGLGLAISRRLARAMSGDLTLQSEVGQGSRFFLELPAAPPVASGTVVSEGRSEGP